MGPLSGRQRFVDPFDGLALLVVVPDRPNAAGFGEDRDVVGDLADLLVDALGELGGGRRILFEALEDLGTPGIAEDFGQTGRHFIDFLSIAAQGGRLSTNQATFAYYGKSSSRLAEQSRKSREISAPMAETWRFERFCGATTECHCNDEAWTGEKPIRASVSLMHFLLPPGDSAA